jgi:site-specific recombinase XerC
VATRMRGMRRFWRWLVSEGELDKAPTGSLPRSRQRGIRGRPPPMLPQLSGLGGSRAN